MKNMKFDATVQFSYVLQICGWTEDTPMILGVFDSAKLAESALRQIDDKYGWEATIYRFQHNKIVRELYEKVSEYAFHKKHQGWINYEHWDNYHKAEISRRGMLSPLCQKLWERGLCTEEEIANKSLNEAFNQGYDFWEKNPKASQDEIDAYITSLPEYTYWQLWMINS